MTTLNEKALEYAQRNEKLCFYEAAIRGYVAGYSQAQSENPYRWRDPRKEKPQCVPGLNSVFVLASIGEANITEIVEYINGGGYERWRTFDTDGIKDHPTDKIKAWMPKPSYIEETV